MKSRRTFLGLTGSAASAVLAGCAGVLEEEGEDEPPVEALETGIVDVRRPDVGFTSATIPLVFEFRNAHPSEEIPSPTVEYTGYVHGESVVSGSEVLPTLDSGDSTTQTFELIAEYEDVGDGVVEAIQGEGFTVRFTGEVSSEGASTGFDERREL